MFEAKRWTVNLVKGISTVVTAVLINMVPTSSYMSTLEAFVTSANQIKFVFHADRGY